LLLHQHHVPCLHKLPGLDTVDVDTAGKVGGIKERTQYGRMMYLKNGGKFERPKGSTESEKEFLNKPDSKVIRNHLERDHSIREISNIVGCSTNKVINVKKMD